MRRSVGMPTALNCGVSALPHHYRRLSRQRSATSNAPDTGSRRSRWNATPSPCSGWQANVRVSAGTSRQRVATPDAPKTPSSHRPLRHVRWLCAGWLIMNSFPPCTNGCLDVHFASPTPVERHARAGGHPVPMALNPWIPAFAGMTRGYKHWQGIYEMDI